jgi:hypothetical protein
MTAASHLLGLGRMAMSAQPCHILILQNGKAFRKT